MVLYKNKNNDIIRGRRGRDPVVVGFTLPMQSVPITIEVVSSKLDQGEVYNINYVIKFVSDWQ